MFFVFSGTFRADAESLSKEVDDQKKVNKQLQIKLRKGVDHIKHLEKELEQEQNKGEQQATMFKSTCQKLQEDLDEKSITIAHVMAQLHDQRRTAAFTEHSQTYGISSKSPKESMAPKFTPAPPSQLAPKFRRRSSGKSVILNDQGNTVATVMSCTGRKSTERPNSTENIPDPTPFLQVNGNSTDLAVRSSERQVLPPIRSGDELVISSNLTRPSHKSPNLTLVHQHGKRKVGRSSSSPEVEVQTLAVDATNLVRPSRNFNSADCN